MICVGRVGSLYCIPTREVSARVDIWSNFVVLETWLAASIQVVKAQWRVNSGANA